LERGFLKKIHKCSIAYEIVEVMFGRECMEWILFFTGCESSTERNPNVHYGSCVGA